MSGKGDKRRPTLISQREEDLRWELAFRCKDNPERRDEILKLLEEIQNEKQNNH